MLLLACVLGYLIASSAWALYVLKAEQVEQRLVKDERSYYVNPRNGTEPCLERVVERTIERDRSACCVCGYRAAGD